MLKKLAIAQVSALKKTGVFKRLPHSEPSRTFDLTKASERIAFYEKHKLQFSYDPQDPGYWRFLTDEKPRLEDNDPSINTTETWANRQCMAVTESEYLPLKINQISKEALDFEGLRVPEFVLEAINSRLIRVDYLADPTWISKYQIPIFSRSRNHNCYIKYAAPGLLVAHVRKDKEAGLYHRLVMALTVDKSGNRKKPVTVEQFFYYPPGDLSYNKLMERAKKRHYFNCRSFEEAYRNNLF